MFDVTPTAEQDAVREIVVAFEAAWNKHDPDRFAALLAEDAEWGERRGLVVARAVEREAGVRMDPRSCVQEHPVARGRDLNPISHTGYSHRCGYGHDRQLHDPGWGCRPWEKGQIVDRRREAVRTLADRERSEYRDRP